MTRAQTLVHIATPIFYVNARPHIGHLYTTVLSDAVARWHRLFNHPVLLTTGTDEHGIKIMDAAKDRSKDVREHCQETSLEFRRLFESAHVSYDDFIRTTEGRHREKVSWMWEELMKRGYIYKGKHEGWYSVSDETFYPDSQVMESVGLDGRPQHVSIETGKKVDRVQEENYMFRLSHFIQPIQEWIQRHPKVIFPEHRRHAVLADLDALQHDLSVSRPVTRQPWGIPVPNDPSQTIYVWLDALTNYLTVRPNPNAHAIHIIGKDILKFHAIYWPAFLMALDLPLPETITAHGHWTIDRVKMSKSLGNVVDPFSILSEFGVDPVRYFLLRDGGLNHDGDFSTDLIKIRYQVELADQLGNLLARCTAKSLNPSGKVPEVSEKWHDDDLKLFETMNKLKGSVDGHFRQGNFFRGLSDIISAIHHTNQYITKNAPWKLVKDERTKERSQHVLYACMESLRIIGTILSPVMPSSMKTMLDALVVPEDNRKAVDLEVNETGKNRTGMELPSQEKKLILFPRLKNK